MWSVSVDSVVEVGVAGGDWGSAASEHGVSSEGVKGSNDVDVDGRRGLWLLA